MVGGYEWKEMKVDRPRRLVLRCHVLHNSIMVNSKKFIGVRIVGGSGVLMCLYSREWM